jgi:hypothetical protein
MRNVFPSKNLYPEYHFYWDRSQFSGSDVQEFYVGELYRSRMTWRNPGSEYVRDDAFAPFVPIMNGVMPAYEFYGENRLTRAQLHVLLGELTALLQPIAAAQTVSQLKASFDDRVDVHDADFAEKKAALTLMVEDFAVLAKLAIKHRLPLWILGP